MEAVKVTDLHKSYGDFQAVKGITFDVHEGEVFGLIGPNGAGKTTTLRLLATLLEITGGKVEIFGKDLKNEAPEIRKIISYLPEDAGAYKNMTGRQYLEFIAGFFIGEKDPVEMVKRGLEIVNLDDRIDDKVETYSKGMARKLLVGRALMMEPKLAILDELTSGLDVVNAQGIRRIVRNKTREGTTVLLSSHNMLEVELMCDRIALINDGRIMEMGTPKELKEKYSANNIEDVFVEVVR
ncbi:MAG: ABC transporter ATP-binding protein [Euryarchaeota archaeon]|nr:ABC transporter ATP-binding protein [Euryarchaeota archaeon]